MDHPASSGEAIILAVDPGTSKCGVAIVRASAPPETLFKATVDTDKLVVEIGRAMRRAPQIAAIVMGNGTASRTLAKAIAEMFPDAPLTLVDEHGSSQRARRAYLLQNPPTGWRRMLPVGLRTPDRPYDDIVAETLAREFIATW